MNLYSFDSDPVCPDQTSPNERAAHRAEKTGAARARSRRSGAQEHGDRARESGRRFDVGMGVSRP